LAGAYRSVLGHFSTSLGGTRSDPKEKEGKVKMALQMLCAVPACCAEGRSRGRYGSWQSARYERRGSGYEVGASLAAERDHTISTGVMALSWVHCEFKSTLRHVRSMKGESNYRLVQMISRQSTSRRFSTPSIPLSLQEIVKLSRLSSVCQPLRA